MLSVSIEYDAQKAPLQGAVPALIFVTKQIWYKFGINCYNNSTCTKMQSTQFIWAASYGVL